MENNLLKKNAKSFYWASFFLSKIVVRKSIALYNFCRTLDDIADERNELEKKKENFNKFKREFLNRNIKNPIIFEMWSVIDSEKISLNIVLDLFDGVETDLQEEVIIKSKKELLLYSYRVAGTVGLMMSKILQVKNKEAFKGAINLGIAMQLTNIARDVVEDSKRNRKYIETSFSSIEKTIQDAEIFYKKSFDSISGIPIKSRFSVIVARRIYKKIGDYILTQKNMENYNKAGKIYVPLIAKIGETFYSVLDFLKLLFVQKISNENKESYKILSQEINLDERI